MTHPVEAFFAAWGEPDPDTRAAALRSCLPEGVYYADPRTQDPIRDIDALISYVGMYSQFAMGSRRTSVPLTGTSSRAWSTGTYRAPRTSANWNP